MLGPVPLRGETPSLGSLGGTVGAGVRLPPRALRRKPYDHEVRAAVDFATIDATYADVLQAVHGTFEREWLPEQIAAIRTAILYTKAGAERTRITAADMAKISAPVVGADTLAGHLFVAARDGANAAYAELSAQGVAVPTVTDAALAKAVSDHARAVAQQTADGLSLAASRKAVQLSAGRTPLAVASEVEGYLAGLQHRWELDQLAGAVQQAQNAGRFAVFEPQQERLRFYASELLDSATCEACVDADGTEYDSLDAAQQDYPTGGYVECFGGPRCRGTVVAVDAEV